MTRGSCACCERSTACCWTRARCGARLLRVGRPTPSTWPGPSLDAGFPARRSRERRKERSRLGPPTPRQGDLRCVFSVDVLGEGVDVPSVDTVLLLRPTQSATVLTQQIGRGLREHQNKTTLTVVDLIGQQHRRFRFDTKLRALLDPRNGRLVDQVEQGFPYLPAGCEIKLDRMSREVMLAACGPPPARARGRCSSRTCADSAMSHSRRSSLRRSASWPTSTESPSGPGRDFDATPDCPCDRRSARAGPAASHPPAAASRRSGARGDLSPCPGRAGHARAEHRTASSGC